MDDIVGSPFYVAPEVLQRKYGKVWTRGSKFWTYLPGINPAAPISCVFHPTPHPGSGHLVMWSYNVHSAVWLASFPRRINTADL